MPTIELRTRLIVARLERDGWINAGGTRHEKFAHPDHPEKRIMVPRHRFVSMRVAEGIAKAAGWI